MRFSWSLFIWFVLPYSKLVIPQLTTRSLWVIVCSSGNIHIDYRSRSQSDNQQLLPFFAHFETFLFPLRSYCSVGVSLPVPVFPQIKHLSQPQLLFLFYPHLSIYPTLILPYILLLKGKKICWHGVMVCFANNMRWFNLRAVIKYGSCSL